MEYFQQKKSIKTLKSSNNKIVHNNLRMYQPQITNQEHQLKIKSPHLTSPRKLMSSREVCSKEKLKNSKKFFP